MINKSILHYHILEKLGEGGMGVVYKVHDSKLDRFLALKFLPVRLTVNDTDRARFLQEARAAAAINHPNVCTIYDIIEHEDPSTEGRQQFIAMEYVEGKTLRQLIMDNGQLAINEVVDYALQIAAALEAAHAEDIIHRDIKSENIMISEKGRIKVTDFGLAKLKGSLKLTKTTSTLGTLAYMPPEQIEGEATDARSDIFSFGVVLYEMLSGNLPFKGEYEAAIMYSIINEDPQALENYRSDISSELIHVVNRSLEKDPADRYQNMHDVLIDLKRVKRDSSKVSRKSLKNVPAYEVNEEVKERGLEKKPKQKRSYLIPAVIVSCLVMAVIAFLTFNPFAEESLPKMITTQFTSLLGAEIRPAFHPGGTEIAFSHLEEDRIDYDIYVKVIGSGSMDRLVSSPGDDYNPAWSPDGRYIAYVHLAKEEQDGGIYIIPPRGGTEKKLASLNALQGLWLTNLSWSPDSKTIAFSAKDSSTTFNRIFLLSVDSRQIRELTDGPETNLDDLFCVFSPDGKKLAFVRGTGGAFDIYSIPISGGEAVRLTADSSFIMGLAWTKDGREIIFSSYRNGNENSLWRISANGGEPIHVPMGAGLSFPAIASQGNLLAAERREEYSNIWRVEIPGDKNKKSTPSMFIFSTRSENEAKYSPDGKKIVFSSDRSGSYQIWICDSDGENQYQLTNFEVNYQAGVPSWSHDGNMIAFVVAFGNQIDIYTINIQGGSPHRITKNSAENYFPGYSKDDKWIYFGSTRSGTWQIWKIPAQGGEAVQVTNKGGLIAYESADGNWLYYRKSDIQGIWKKNLAQGEETLVLDLNVANPGQWDLVENGIYYIEKIKSGNFMIYFYDFANGNITEIADLGRKWNRELHVSPDQRWIIVTQVVEESDILLIENFR